MKQRLHIYFHKHLFSNLLFFIVFTLTIVTSGISAYRFSTMAELPNETSETLSETGEDNVAKDYDFGELLPENEQIIDTPSEFDLPPASTNSQSPVSNNCIITLWGKSYNITSLINTHSGGNIFSCGTDMSNTYQSEHGSDLSRMAKYLLSPASAATPTQSPTATLTTTTEGITSAELSNHASSGDCYIGYKGIVYDVSNHSAWGGCSHHGQKGGTDITSKFPHPESYLNGLPIIGSLIGSESTSNQPTSAPTTSASKSDDDMSEYEKKLAECEKKTKPEEIAECYEEAEKKKYEDD
ncbi:hypothetical protein KC717_05645 [Candidatus Dojkabacteria bacterium]|uniref:Cytochrome b5 heme-binding domain-containing protein n=1 Tax=Candidatus Dojkabacteria bacterium TaxID=2099670 RepID=A0A955L8Q5_9BACT|nr:hypothetical protein [Candidatus Dojkabacteria bacterium]